jgi:hypothetical protein
VESTDRGRNLTVEIAGVLSPAEIDEVKAGIDRLTPSLLDSPPTTLVKFSELLPDQLRQRLFWERLVDYEVVRWALQASTWTAEAKSV